MTMKALVLSHYSHLEVVETPKPVPMEDEVLVRVHACGICGSDIHGWDGTSGRRIPPLIMGHEAAGQIAEVGTAVTGWTPGDRVTFDSTIYCGECEECLTGAVNHCSDRRVLGVSPGNYVQDGAFAEYVAIPSRILYKLPDTMEYPVAAMAEPVSIAMHAVSHVENLVARSRAVVVGAGTIGLLIMQALKCAGADQIIAVDLNDRRLDQARKLGATECVNPSTCDALQEIRDLSDGGVDICFEAVGLGVTVQLAIQSLHHGGTAVQVGNIAPSAEIPLQEIVSQEVKFIGSYASAGEYPESLRRLADGSIDVRSMIETVAPLESGPAWFEKLSSKEGGNYLKVILQP